MINLSKARKEKGFNQAKLALMMGVSRSAVAMWETGATQPDNDTLLRLSEILDISIDYLLGNSSIKKGLDQQELTEDQKGMLSDYDRLSPQGQAAARERLLALLERESEEDTP